MNPVDNATIAVITDDGNTISQHFGRATYYLVATIENGQIVKRELRSKLGHSHFAGQHHAGAGTTGPHGLDTDSHNKHLQMSEVISDCQALICGGMGGGAYQSMQARGIRPIVTDITDIDQAILAYIEGKIIDKIERLH